ncbi:MAG: PorT family protein [Proteiniphilum sp.]|jgi:opacity protein-like surface antigen|nr:PorT family protein [Proteiniphilum sp.]
MKKIVLMCLSVLMTTGLATVNAQTPLTFGVKAEANMSNFLLSDLDGQSSAMNLGPTLGGFMNILVHENFSIQPEVMFFYRQSKIETGAAEDDFRQWGVQAPVYFLGQTYINSGKFYAGVGPYVGLGFDARYKDADIDLYKEVNDKKDMNRWDFGLGALVGYEFPIGLQINAGYQIGLIDQLDALKDNATMRAQTVSLGIGYRF